jgi:O-6-methylguanine DNA methyltransferase
MKPTLVQYNAPGWGVGEVWLDDDGRVFYSELPRPRPKRTSLVSDTGDVPAGRVAAAFAMEPGDDGGLARPKWPSLVSDTGDVLAGRLSAFFAGGIDDFADVLLRIEEGFYGDCARALRGVRRGEVVTYGELAALAGRPGAARAAGTFCARCELAPFLPVHRVVAAGGIGSWGTLGVDYKRRLLELEGVAI